MIENIEHLKTLMEVATESMIGKQVTINLRAPIKKWLVGEAYIDADGPVMDINPDAELIVFYFAWLHETGHFYLGHLDNAEPRILPPEIQKSYELNGSLLDIAEGEQEAYDEDPREQDAQSFAYSIDEYARRKATYMFFTADVDFETRIRVLTNIVLQKEPQA